MFDPEMTASSGGPATAPARPAGFRTTWWVLGLAGVAALVVAAAIKPQPVAPAAPAAKASAATAAAEPEQVSLVDTIAKACAGLLVVYAAGWGLVRLKRRGLWPARAGQRGELVPRVRLRVAESLSLGHQRPTLHLVEVDGATLLLGSALDQICVLWTAASDHTSAFKPVTLAEADAEPAPLPPAPWARLAEA